MCALWLCAAEKWNRERVFWSQGLLRGFLRPRLQQLCNLLLSNFPGALSRESFTRCSRNAIIGTISSKISTAILPAFALCQLLCSRRRRSINSASNFCRGGLQSFGTFVDVDKIYSHASAVIDDLRHANRRDFMNDAAHAYSVIAPRLAREYVK